MADNELKYYDDVSVYELSDEREQELLNKQIECVFNWTNKAGHCMGVIMNYVHRDGRVWLTSAKQRVRIKAVQRDPRVSVVISSMGTDMGAGKQITYKGRVVIHEDQETKDWFYPDFARHANSPAPTPEAFVAFLDTPLRVIIEVVPEMTISFDGGVMVDATTAALES